MSFVILHSHRSLILNKTLITVSKILNSGNNCQNIYVLSSTMNAKKDNGALSVKDNNRVNVSDTIS